MLEPSLGGDFRSLAGLTTFSVDSGNRRVRLHAQLQSGSEYRLRLKKEIRDEFGGSANLALAQPKGGGGKDLDLYFSVRKPKGDLKGAIALSAAPLAPVTKCRKGRARPHTTHDGWGRVTELSERDRKDGEIYLRHTEYTEAGQNKSVTASKAFNAELRHDLARVEGRGARA